MPDYIARCGNGDGVEYPISVAGADTPELFAKVQRAARRHLKIQDRLRQLMDVPPPEPTAKGADDGHDTEGNGPKAREAGTPGVCSDERAQGSGGRSSEAEGAGAQGGSVAREGTSGTGAGDTGGDMRGEHSVDPRLQEARERFDETTLLFQAVVALADELGMADGELLTKLRRRAAAKSKGELLDEYLEKQDADKLANKPTQRFFRLEKPEPLPPILSLHQINAGMTAKPPLPPMPQIADHRARLDVPATQRYEDTEAGIKAKQAMYARMFERLGIKSETPA